MGDWGIRAPLLHSQPAVDKHTTKSLQFLSIHSQTASKSDKINSFHCQPFHQITFSFYCSNSNSVFLLQTALLSAQAPPEPQKKAIFCNRTERRQPLPPHNSLRFISESNSSRGEDGGGAVVCVCVVGGCVCGPSLTMSCNGCMELKQIAEVVC